MAGQAGPAMSAAEILGWAALGASVVGPFLVFAASRRSNATNARKAESDVQNASFTANLELTRYIDERVKEQVAERMKPLEAELTQNRTVLGAVRRLLRAMVAQWPENQPGPILDIHDLVIAEEAVPPEWSRPGKGEAPGRGSPGAHT